MNKENTNKNENGFQIPESLGAIIFTVYWIKRSKKKEQELMDQGRIAMHNPKDSDLQ